MLNRSVEYGKNYKIKKIIFGMWRGPSPMHTHFFRSQDLLYGTEDNLVKTTITNFYYAQQQ